MRAVGCCGLLWGLCNDGWHGPLSSPQERAQLPPLAKLEGSAELEVFVVYISLDFFFFKTPLLVKLNPLCEKS